MSHASQSLAPEAPAQAPRPPLARTGRLSSVRRTSRDTVAALLDATLTAHTRSSDRAAERMGVTETVVRHKRAGDAGLHLDELVAMGTPVALDVLDALVARLRGNRVPSRLPP